MKWILASYYILSIATAADVDVFTKIDTESKTLGSQNGGWTRIAQFDLSIHGTKCPDPWILADVDGKSYCRVPTDNSGCSSVIYHITEYYNMTRGLVRGYQRGTPDGFALSRDENAGINDPYVDGVSITIGSNPRRHVWTYAAGLTSMGNYPNNNCPCAVTPGPDPPSFVGKNYYCSSGSPNFPAHDHLCADIPLWQGTNCTDAKDNCCGNVGLPWFYREFPTYQHEDFEVRICYNQGYSDESIFIDKLELYIYAH